jgi:hypothetical protein
MTKGTVSLAPWRLVLLFSALPFGWLALGGCGTPLLPWDGAFGTVEGQALTSSRIVASVTERSPETGLPTTLSGTVSGRYAGTYHEEILEVYSDSTGAPIAALSKSDFTLDLGTFTSLNLIVVVEPIVSTDASGSPVLTEQGTPVVIGLRTSSTGEIIHATGSFAGATGELHTESTLLLSGGDSGLGAVDAELTVSLDTDVAG